MAKHIPSVAIGSMTKTAGGVTFSHGPFGAVFGSKSSPVNSRSAAQLGIRAGFSALTKRWARTLTAAQQAGWVAFAAAHQIHDTLGQLITLTGVQTYVRLNGALKAAGQPTIDVAPGAVSAGSPGLITLLARHAGPLELTVTPTVGPGANDCPIIWSVRPLTIGFNAFTRHLKVVKVFPPGTAGPWDILAEWGAQYGLLLQTAVIVASVQYTDSTTGWQGTMSAGRTDVL